MNVGNLITRNLTRARLPVGDHPTREFALDFLNEIIHEYWYAHKFTFRKSPFSFTTTNGVEEYALHKLAGDVLLNTMRGSDPVRMIKFRPAHEFLRNHQHSLASGDPYEYRDGEYIGVETQPSASSPITFSSSLSNITTGTVIVVQGSTLVTVSTAIVTIDWLGRWFRVGTDDKRYKVVAVLSTTTFTIHAPYEQVSNTTASYAIGDVQQKGIAYGLLDNGTVRKEEVQLNGGTGVATVQSFATLIRISKSDKTTGYITATSNGALITNLILDPAETEIDLRTILMYQIPAKAELISYQSFSKHPILSDNTESPLFPVKYHPLLSIDLFIRLMNEYREKEVSPDVLRRRDKMYDRMIVRDQDTDEWHVVQETESRSLQAQSTNLPENYGLGYGDY